MVILLIIYLLGVVAVPILGYFLKKRDARRGYIANITLEDVTIILIFSVLSWITFILMIGMEWGDVVLFRINNNGKEI